MNTFIAFVALVSCIVIAMSNASSLQRNQQTNDDSINARGNLANQMNDIPEAENFLHKIVDRLNKSTILASNDLIKEKIIELAVAKVYNCKSHTGIGLDKGCIGSETGHIMQLIAALENVSREPQFIPRMPVLE